MTGRPWYAFYPDAYDRKAGDLSYVQDSAYRRLLDQYYKTGEPLSLDKEKLYRACRAMRREERTAIDFCLATFFNLSEHGYQQDRADEEIAKASEISSKRSAAASKRHNKTDANAHAIAEQKHTHSTATSTATAEPNGSALGASQAKPPRSRKSRRGIPEDFPDEASLAFATELWTQRGRTDLLTGIADQAAQFRDHHAKTGNPMADWPAAWRTWARNALNFTRAPAQSQFPQAKILKVV